MGFSLQDMAQKTSRSTTYLSQIERNKSPLPGRGELKDWLKALGISGRKLTDMLDMAEEYQYRQVLQLRQDEQCNPDIARLNRAYKDHKLTHFDRILLLLVGHNERVYRKTEGKLTQSYESRKGKNNEQE